MTGEIEPMARKLQADVVIETAARQMRELAERGRRPPRPVSRRFPGSFFTLGIEVEGGVGEGPERGCVVLGAGRRAARAGDKHRLHPGSDRPGDGARRDAEAAGASSARLRCLRLQRVDARHGAADGAASRRVGVSGVRLRQRRSNGAFVRRGAVFVIIDVAFRGGASRVILTGSQRSGNGPAKARRSQAACKPLRSRRRWRCCFRRLFCRSSRGNSKRRRATPHRARGSRRGRSPLRARC